MKGPTKRALLVGINRYEKLSRRSQLDGCVNDVALMRDVLQSRFGFDPQNITTLRDEKATRDGMLSAMEGLVTATQPGDIVAFHYSGHGSQMTDRTGEEEDEKDETIMPSDTGRTFEPNRDIIDDEIYLWVERLTQKTPYVTLIFDCCHSGTMSDTGASADAASVVSAPPDEDQADTTNVGVSEGKARSVEPDLRPKEELPPPPVSRQELERAARRRGSGGWWLPFEERYVVIAGARDDEIAREHRVKVGDETQVHGALTYHLCQELRRSDAAMTYRDLFVTASEQVLAEHPKQHPQMEGVLDRELFGRRNLRVSEPVAQERRHAAPVM